MEKVKLSCCENNTNGPNKCDHCQCLFESADLLDAHYREIHPLRFVRKRKSSCCEENEKKRQKFFQHQCDYCECTFQKKVQLKCHVGQVHGCATCGQTMLTKDVRSEHEIKHAEERREREENERKEMELKELQHQKDDDLILNYVKTNKLDEFPSDPDYQPDHQYIYNNFLHKLDNEELLRFAKKFGVSGIFDDDGEFEDFFDRITYNQIVHLLENDVVSVEDVADYISNMTDSYYPPDIMPELVTYFLDKDYEIKREWVAKLVDRDDALIERIKQKHTYTFDEIYGARDLSEFHQNADRDEFYKQVHEHFPDPDYEEPFANYKLVKSKHVHDHLHHRYCYDKKNDELSILIKLYSRNEHREISLGKCKELFQKNLQELKMEYEKATKEYDEANQTVQDLFDEREAALDEDREEGRCHLTTLDDYYDKIYGEAIPDRNFWANKVSMLYFVISKMKTKSKNSAAEAASSTSSESESETSGSESDTSETSGSESSTPETS